MMRESSTCYRMTRLWRSFERPGSISHAGPSQNTARQCVYLPRYSGVARNWRLAPELLSCRIDVRNNFKVKYLAPDRPMALQGAHGGHRMPLRVSGRNISIGAALQRKITSRVEE